MTSPLESPASKKLRLIDARALLDGLEPLFAGLRHRGFGQKRLRVGGSLRLRHAASTGRSTMRQSSPAPSVA